MCGLTCRSWSSLQARGTGFFLSPDGRFIIKTHTRSECDQLLALLPEYRRHMDSYPHSWLVHFYGVYRVQCSPNARPVYFVVMNNVFRTRKHLAERYDLKGSTLGRQTSRETTTSDSSSMSSGRAGRAHRAALVLKDLDLLDSHSRLRLGSRRKRILIDQLSADVDFLRRRALMDYSLLVAIHRTRMPPLALLAHALSIIRRRGSDGLPSQSGRELYFVGVIDVLQRYTLRKFFETQIKSLRHSTAEISCVPPAQYAERFCGFVERVAE